MAIVGRRIEVEPRLGFWSGNVWLGGEALPQWFAGQQSCAWLRCMQPSRRQGSCYLCFIFSTRTVDEAQ